MNTPIIPKLTHNVWETWWEENADHANLGHHFLATMMPGVVDLQLENMTGDEAAVYIESVYVQPSISGAKDGTADDTAFALPA